jgi:hypothetical protein
MSEVAHHFTTAQQIVEPTGQRNHGSKCSCDDCLIEAAQRGEDISPEAKPL